MANLRYNHPLDNIIGNATLSLPTGAADAAYPLANIRDGAPELPFKATTASIRIVFDFGSAVSLGLVSLIHHNFDTGLNVRWQGHTADSWSAPDHDVAFTMPAKDDDDYYDNPFLDLTGLAAKRYWSLVNLSANSVNVVIGEIWIGSTTRTAVNNYHWGGRDAESRRSVRQTTAADIEFRYDRGGRRRRLTGQTKTTDAGYTAFRAWSRACRSTVRSTLIVPDPAVNSAWLARWETGEDTFERSPQMVDHNDIPLAWVELSRGLPW